MSVRSSVGVALCMASAVFVSPVHAALQLQAESVSMPAFQAKQVSATVSMASAGVAHVQLTIESLSAPTLGWESVALAFNGQLERHPGPRWALHGDLKLRGAPGHAMHSGELALLADIDANTLQSNLSAASARIELVMPLDQPSHIQLDLESVPATWLQGMLQQVWGAGQSSAGRVGAHVALDMHESGMRSTGSFNMHEIGVDSTSGSIAARSLSASGRFAFDSTGPSSRLELDSVLRGGEVLLGPLYANLPAHAAQLKLQADFSDRRTRISSLHFDDKDALRTNASMTFGPDGSLTAIEFADMHAVLPAAYARYAKSWLLTQGYADLKTTGMLDASFEYAMGLERFVVDAQAVNVIDPSGRIGAHDLTGILAWSREGEQGSTELAWQGLRLLGIPLGPATSRWQSTSGTLSLQSATAIPLLGGTLLLQRAAWRPRASEDEASVDLGFVLTEVDLPALCEVFGWPRFSGTLGGAVPGLTLTGERIELQGGLLVHVFNGFVNVTELSLQDPFGLAPVLHADIDIEKLDLEPLTRVFEFGSITGQLNGSVENLRTINWLPVAFDAEVHTLGTGRISQRAINSLSNLGGGGIVGGLQGAMLSIFDSFGYSAIGLNCRLHNDICDMGGLHPVKGGGYLIVDGRGLPHIEVIGHERAVDWSVLVARLREATQGESKPRIE